MGQLYSIKEETLVAIADSVRTVTGTTGDISPEEFAVKIVEGGSAALPELSNEGTASDLMLNKELIDGDGKKVTGTFTIDSELTTQDNLISQIQTALSGKASGTLKLQEKTATPTTSSQTITPDSTYDGLSKVTVNAMPTATQATPSINVNSSGLITASATQTAGYVSSGTKSATKQLTVQAAKTVTPTTSNQTAVASGVYTTGAITVKGDANLKAENIAEGVSIFGITGTHSGGGSGGGSGEVATCTIEIVNNTIGKMMESHITMIWFIAYENGEYKGYSGNNGYNDILPPNFDWSAQTITINNVVCGSMMYLADENRTINTPDYSTWNINGSLDDCYLLIPSTPNVTHTIKLESPW